MSGIAFYTMSGVKNLTHFSAVSDSTNLACNPSNNLYFLLLRFFHEGLMLMYIMITVFNFFYMFDVRKCFFNRWAKLEAENFLIDLVCAWKKSKFEKNLDKWNTFYHISNVLIFLFKSCLFVIVFHFGLYYGLLFKSCLFVIVSAKVYCIMWWYFSRFLKVFMWFYLMKHV